MDSFIKYIRQYLQSNSCASSSINWWDLYKDKKNFVRNNEFYDVGNDDFKKIISEIPHSLNRNDIFTYFQEKDYYKGFVSAMLWGGIGLPPSKKEYMNSAFSISKEEIEQRIKNLQSLLSQNNIRNAFLSMSEPYKNGNEGGNKIPGIGISYFTKLLFFLGNKQMPIRPLIYDAVLQKVHSALIKDDFEELNKFFTISTFSVSDSSISIKGGRFESGKEWEPVDYYMDYIMRMTNLANNELSQYIEEEGLQGKSGRLEEILFGSPLSKKKGENDPSKNPRAFVSDYLGLSNFAEEIKSKSKNSQKTTGTKNTHRKSNKKENLENKHEISLNKSHQATDPWLTHLKKYKGENLKEKRDRAIRITEGYQILIKQHVAWVYYGIDPSHKKNYHICKIVFRDKDGKEDKLANKHQIIPNIILDLFPLPRKKEQPSYYQYCEFKNEIEARDKFFEVLSALCK